MQAHTPIMVHYNRPDDTISGTVHFERDAVQVSIPYRSIVGAYRALVGIGAEDSIEGFFDFVKKTLHKVATIANNPVVKAVASVIPYGATAVTVLDAADKGVALASDAIAKKPTVHRLIAAATKGDPRAKQLLRSLPPAMKTQVRQAEMLQRRALQLSRDLKEAKGILKHVGITPKLLSALQHSAAPWV